RASCQGRPRGPMKAENAGHEGPAFSEDGNQAALRRGRAKVSRTHLEKDQRGLPEAGRALTMIRSPVKGLVPQPALRALTSRQVRAPSTGKRTRCPPAADLTAASKVSLTAAFRVERLTLTPSRVSDSWSRLVKVEAVHFLVVAMKASSIA